MVGCQKCSKVSAILFLVLGLLFLLVDLDFWDFWNIHWWTAVLLVGGIVCLSMSSCKACKVSSAPSRKR